jgi:hypothetical protein
MSTVLDRAPGIGESNADIAQLNLNAILPEAARPWMLTKQLKWLGNILPLQSLRCATKRIVLDPVLRLFREFSHRLIVFPRPILNSKILVEFHVVPDGCSSEAGCASEVLEAIVNLASEDVVNVEEKGRRKR